MREVIASGDGRATSVMRTIPKRSSHAIPVHGDSEQTLVDLDELSVIAWQVRQATLEFFERESKKANTPFSRRRLDLRSHHAWPRPSWRISRLKRCRSCSVLCSLITAMLQDMRCYHYVAVRALLGKHLIMVPDHILPGSRAVVGLQPGFELHSRLGPLEAQAAKDRESLHWARHKKLVGTGGRWLHGRATGSFKRTSGTRYHSR